MKKAETFTAQLGLGEKVYMVTGRITLEERCIGSTLRIERLDFMGTYLQDGVVGVRITNLTNVFLAGLTVAAS